MQFSHRLRIKSLFFLRVFIPTALCLAAVVYFWSAHETTRYHERLQQDAKNALERQATILLTELNIFKADTRFLADLAKLHLVRAIHSPGEMLDLTRVLYLFIHDKRIYDQVRLLSPEGVELIRINTLLSGPMIVPEFSLQDKKQRPYFQRGKDARDSVFISRFDLNEENNLVETPHKPVLRFARAVLSNKNQLLGVMVLNLLGESILHQLHIVSARETGKIYMLNSQGYWLAGPDREKEWGFVLPERRDERFAKYFPQAWAVMKGALRGEIVTEEGFFYHLTLPISTGPVSSKTQDPYWRLVYHISPEQYRAPSAKYAWPIFFSGLSLSTILLWAWASARARRAMAERALKDSEQRFRDVSEAAGEYIWETGPDGNYSFVSGRASSVLGYAPEELVGRSPFDFLWEEDAWDIRKVYIDSALSKTPFSHAEYRVKSRSGELVWQRVSAVPILGEDGETQGFRGVVMDVTDAKRAEEALRESEARFQAMATNAPGVIFQWYERRQQDTVTHGFHYVSPRSLDLYELAPETLMKDWTKLALHPADEKRWKRSILKSMREVSEWSFEGRFLLSSGKVKWWRGVGKPVQTSPEEVVLNGVIIDITELKQAEEALKYQNILLTTQQETSPDGILVSDPNQIMHNWNKRFLDMWRIPEEMMRSADGSVLEYTLEQVQDPEAFKGRIVELFQNIDEVEMGVEIDFKDGRCYVRHSRGLKDATGEYWGRIWFYRDITERKKAEKQLVEMATLDSLTQIANRRFFMEQATKELERAKRYNHPLSMIMFDADYFKNVNDTYGHDVGDEVLKMLAETGRSCLREVDVFGRIGGEEFAVLLPETDIGGAVQVAERIRSQVEAATVTAQSGQKAQVRITVSLGVSTFGGRAENLEQLLKLADQALYEAKNKGRNRLEIAH